MLKQTPKVKIALRRCYKRLGKANDVVSVRGGYARNYLIPNEIAYLIDRRTAKLIANHQDTIAKMQDQDQERYSIIAKKLEQAQITIFRQADKEGSLYRRVKAKDIIEAVKQHHQQDIYSNWFREKISFKHLTQPEKPLSIFGSVGEHSFTLLLNISAPKV